MANVHDEYLFYHKDIPNMVIFKISQNFIHIWNTFKGDFIQIPRNEIISIAHKTFTIKSAVFNQLQIKTKSNFFKKGIDLNDLDNVEYLFKLLDDMYGYFLEEKLNYEQYLSFAAQGKIQNYVIFYGTLSLIIIFISILLYSIITDVISTK